MVARGEIWAVALGPTVGREIRKTRPALVVSPDELNASLETVIVLPMTTAGSPAPFRLSVTLEGKTGLILPDQIRAVDRQRLMRRIGRVSGKTLVATLRLLQEMFAE